MPSRAQGFDGRRDDRLLLGAERAVLAGMRIEAGYREARAAMPKRVFRSATDDAGGR